MEEYICKYCGKVCKNKNSLVQHEIRCKENPNRKYRIAWNKGLTKQNDPRVAKYANTYKENYKNGKFKIWSDGLTKDSSKINKLSIKVKETVDKKIITDSWHTSFSKARTQVYKGIKMMGNWEVEFAKLLDEKDIKWIYTNDKFDYVYENIDKILEKIFKEDINTSSIISIKEINPTIKKEDIINILRNVNLKNLAIIDV